MAVGRTKQFGARARSALERSELLLSPMAFLELDYLREIGRGKMGASDVLRKLEAEIGLRLCDLDFATVATAALDESWTRDPFDRIIVANAKARGFALLISADATIQQHYPRAIW
jgi:PIN domain nuclease of toxin-antitoxin system